MSDSVPSKKLDLILRIENCLMLLWIDRIPCEHRARELLREAADALRAAHEPRLGKRAAFTVIYVLQERFRLIPDNIEQCDVCLELFDEHEGGCYDSKTGKHLCASCEPHYSSQGEEGSR